MSTSEASNNKSINMPAAASNIGKKTIAVSKTSYGALEQEGDLISGYPVFSSEMDDKDRLRFLFGKTWRAITTNGKEGIAYPNSGHDRTVDRFFIDWYNSFSDTKLFPLGMPTSDPDRMPDYLMKYRFKFLYGSELENNKKETFNNLPADLKFGPKPGFSGKIYIDSAGNDKYTFEHTKQYEETIKIRVDLDSFHEPFETNLPKNNFESLFEDSSYSYYNPEAGEVFEGATLKSIINFDKWFFDYSFTYNRPFTNAELNHLNSVPGPSHASIDVHYSPNFSFEEYKETISNNKVSERALPMYYAFPEVAGYLNNQEFSQTGMFESFDAGEYGEHAVHGSIFKESITLKKGNLDGFNTTGIDKYETLKNLYGGNTIDKDLGIDHKLAGSSDKELYYKLFSLRMEQFLGVGGVDDLAGPIHEKISQKYKTICLTDSKKDLLTSYDYVRPQYPMSVGISFSSDKKKDFSNILNQTHMMAPTMVYISKNSTSAVSTPFVELSEKTTIDEFSPQSTPEKQYVKDENITRKSWDLTNIISEYIQDFNSFFDWQTQKSTTFISDNSIDFLNPKQSLVKFLFSNTALLQVMYYADKTARTYEDILNGVKNEASEILFYRIEKSSANEVIQNILVPNMAEQSIINILDTQVKYDKYYNYKIYAYHAVAGTMYRYVRVPTITDTSIKNGIKFFYNWDSEIPVEAPVEAEPDDECDADNPFPIPICNDLILGGQDLGEAPENFFPILIDPEGKYMEASIKVLTQPTIRLIEVPYFNVEDTKPTIILDKPPVPPDINIVPFSGIHNKILILFNSSVGDYTLDPVSMAFGDSEEFDKIRDSQGLGPGDPINFQTDDPNVSYQVFRISTPPLSYDDFSLASPKSIDKTSFIDTVSPNQKYYYTFRAIDSNGHISNPTEVYEVQLVTLEDGSDVSKAAILPLIKEYNFPEAELTYATRDFRKFLLIKPAMGQDEINFETSNLPGSSTNEDNPDLIRPNFGVKEKKIFSQSTGKYDPDTGTWIEISGSVPRYKLRVTSRTTGRKVDVNFKFTNKRREQ